MVSTQLCGHWGLKQEAESWKPSVDTVLEVMKVVRDSKFRHVFGEAQKVRYDDLRLSSKATESVGIRANSKFFTVAWDSGGGGALAVVPLKKTGRLPRDQKLITGHAGPILDFEFNPFDDNMIASCSEDLTVKIWNVPDDGLSAHLRPSVIDVFAHVYPLWTPPCATGT